MQECVQEDASGVPAAELPRQAIPHTEEFRGHLLHYTKPASASSSARASPSSSIHMERLQGSQQHPNHLWHSAVIVVMSAMMLNNVRCE